MKAYFVIREDLQLSPAKLAIQVGHGVDLIWMNCSSIDGFTDWLDPTVGDRRKLLLKIKSEEKLVNLMKALEDEGLECHRIVDSGYYELEQKTWTGIVVFPSRIQSKKLNRLRLY